MTDQTQNLSAVEPVATKLETMPFDCFHVSLDDAERLKALPVGTKLYTSPPTTSAAVAAALMKAEEVCIDYENNFFETRLRNKIRAIPRDQSALRDALTEAITAYARQVATKNNGNIVLLDLEEALAIVERVLKGEE